MITIGLRSSLAHRKGGRRLMILRALDRLDSVGVSVIRTSPFYEAEPVTRHNDPSFVIMVAKVKTDLSAVDLIKACTDIQYDLGRTRSIKNGSRLIDIDVLTYNDDVVETENLIVPHPLVTSRAYFLLPMADVGNNWAHPKSKLSIDELLDDLPHGQWVKRL